ncbi:carboxylesterase/lipase family protein [Celerinatantimonas diazotrophica]|uniref:Carboxylic ester hydrolase n=1 Tax=Celerinatantimonas diazotrophica TaxID=412034 RepID=A0A4R1K7K8_9GAMM|nr:carboxylesterase family protein [Celerinatantimonas diazotrophica]TCK59049.1 para-nitrobenzyl esterase [Celerinatantimonas diazotrophica]CAG9297684.1 Para-nitrobenzyl esterase [Celerinatantimonas diazotrophica]
MKPCKWLLTFFLVAFSIGESVIAAPIVQLHSGRVEGRSVNGVDAFLGIPYAKPPVGKLRWQRPLSATSWQGIKKTTAFGPSCLQTPMKGSSTPLPDHYSENCLTLNVWRPSRGNGRLPVMVWIYGGGFVNGGSASPVYSGKAFAKSGVIFVSFNYRLGRLGFFAHPALSGNLFRGNYGLMDQIKALRWVQDNIISFGGDPNNVTVVGESAGGYSIHALLTSHYSRNLFNKAIIESGGGRYQINGQYPWKKAQQTGVRFAKQLGIESSGQQALAKLRSLPGKTIAGDLNMWNMEAQRQTYSGPMMDGHVISENPEKAYRAGDFAHVPLLVGANDDDLGFVRQHYQNRAQVLAMFGQHQSQAAKAYRDIQGTKALSELIARQKMMIEPARFVAQEFAGQNVPVWEYRFGYVANAREGQWQGAKHASEIAYVFKTLAATYGPNVTARDQKMADLIHQYWVNFAKTGNPNGASLPHWPAYSSKTDQLMWFSPKGATQSHALRDPQQAQLNMVETLAK